MPPKEIHKMNILTLFAMFSMLFQPSPAGSFVSAKAETRLSSVRNMEILNKDIHADDVICPDCPQPLPIFVVQVDGAGVYGSPRSDVNVIRTLKYGDIVRARDFGRGYGVGWVMIAPAEWVEINNLWRYIP
jgi:hypothetical protein